MSKMLKAKEAAEFLGVHVETLRRLARNGEIPSFKIGKDWRFNKDALERWMENQYIPSSGQHVLVVDDDEIVLETLREMVETEGYRVTTVSDGSKALPLIESSAVDLVLLNLKMPVMDGPTTLKKIREIDPDMPVILITEYPDSDLMMEALSNSPIMVLPKPLQHSQLVEAIYMAKNWRRT